MLLLTLALAANPGSGGSAETYTGCGEIPAGQDLAAAAFHEPVARGGGF